MTTLELTRVLYVEDEEDIRTIASMALSALGGLQVVSCANGTEALARAAESEADLLLLDVMMPGMDGPQTLHALRGIEATARTPAVFMTAKVQAHEVARYLEMGALGVIAKPFDPMTLADELRRLWNTAGAPVSNAK